MKYLMYIAPALIIIFSSQSAIAGAEIDSHHEVFNGCDIVEEDESLDIKVEICENGVLRWSNVSTPNGNDIYKLVDRSTRTATITNFIGDTTLYTETYDIDNIETVLIKSGEQHIVRLKNSLISKFENESDQICIVTTYDRVYEFVNDYVITDIDSIESFPCVL